MTGIQCCKSALQEHQIEEDVTAQIFEGHANISDKAKKEKKAANFVQAIERMEQLLDGNLYHDIRDACVCSKVGCG